MIEDQEETLREASLEQALKNLAENSTAVTGLSARPTRITVEAFGFNIGKHEFSHVPKTIMNGTSALEAVQSISALVDKARALLDSVSHDDSGSMVAGQWMGGEGGLISRATLDAAHALRLELDNWKK